MLTRVRPTLGLEVLVLAVDALLHHPAQQALVVAHQQRIPARTPQDLDDVPAGAEKGRLELLDDLAVAAHRAIEPLQVAVDDENEVVESLAHRHGERAHRLRLVHLAVAEECPHLPIRGLHQPAVLQVTGEAGLENRHHGTQAHRHRRELPEIRHQPRVRIGRQAHTRATRLLAEVQQPLLVEASFQIRARVDTGRGVSLHEHHVTGVLLGGGAPDVIETHFIQGRGGGVAREVAAVLGRSAIGLQHHRQRVPADVGLDTPLERAIARVLRLAPGGNAVDVGGVGLERQVGAAAARVVDQPLEQEVRALRSVSLEHRIDRFEPFPRLNGIEVFQLRRFGHVISARLWQRACCAGSR